MVDETETPLVVQGEDGIFSLLMNHIRIRKRSIGGVLSDFDLMLPAQALEDTRSETLDAAIKTLIGPILAELEQCKVPVIRVLNSDKAKSLLKLGRIYGQAAREDASGLSASLHGNCMMHMMWAALVHALGPYKLASDLFCATTLLHRASNHSTIKRCLKQYVRGNLKRVFDAPPDVYRERNASLIDMLDAADFRFFEHIDGNGVIADDRPRFEARREARLSFVPWRAHFKLARAPLRFQRRKLP
jgi:hypothetical protein